MRGHIRKRGDSYCYVIDVGRGSNGRRKQQWKSGFRTKKEAEAALAAAMRAVNTGDHVARSSVKYGSYVLDQWLPGRENDLRPSTFASYTGNLTGHVVPAIGHRPLQELTPADLNALYGSLLRAKDQGGTGLAPKTVRYIHTTVRKSLADAQRWGLVNRNVADLANPPKVKRAMDHVTWSAEEAGAFLDFVADDDLYALWHLALHTGMRRGELLGSRWSDMDPSQGLLAVRQTVVSVAYEIQFGTPKTAKGRREIALDSETVLVLTRHRKELEARGTDTHTKAALLFPGSDGTALHPQLVSDRFNRLVERSGLPRIRLHDLRHTHATLALAARVNPKIVSERLGHSTVAFTMDVYSHALPSMQQEAAEAVAGLIAPGRRP